MEETNALQNIEHKQDYAIFAVNTQIYDLEVIKSAAYVMLDKAYVVLDGDPASKVMVEIRKKQQEQDLKQLVYDFNSELINYSVYKQQTERNKTIRELILQRVLFTNAPKIFVKKKEDNKENNTEESTHSDTKKEDGEVKDGNYPTQP